MSRQPKFFKTNPKAIDPLKIEVCGAIDRVISRNQWTQRQAAIMMGTSRANISRVSNKKLDRLTLCQLFGYLARSCPDFRFMISIDSTLTSARPTLYPKEKLSDAEGAQALDRSDRDHVSQDIHDQQLAKGVFPGAHFAPSDAGRGEALQGDHEK